MKYTFTQFKQIIYFSSDSLYKAHYIVKQQKIFKSKNYLLLRTLYDLKDIIIDSHHITIFNIYHTLDDHLKYNSHYDWDYKYIHEIFAILLSVETFSKFRKDIEKYSHKNEYIMILLLLLIDILYREYNFMIKGNNNLYLECLIIPIIKKDYFYIIKIPYFKGNMLTRFFIKNCYKEFGQYI